MTAAPPTQTDLKSTLEELRASVAAEGTRGLKGAMQQAFLGLLSVLLAILEDFRAGRLARIAPVAEPGDGADGAVADPSPRPSPAGGESPIPVADRWARDAWHPRRDCPSASRCADPAPRINARVRAEDGGKPAPSPRFIAPSAVGNDSAIATLRRMAECARHWPRCSALRRNGGRRGGGIF